VCGFTIKVCAVLPKRKLGVDRAHQLRCGSFFALGNNGGSASDDTRERTKVVAGRYKIVIAELKKEMSSSEKQMDEPVFLDPDQKSPRAKDFEDRLGGES